MRDRLRWDGTTGPPRSSNAASSFHLQWVVGAPPAGRSWVSVEAVLEVLVPPAVPALSFWALQASFADRGRHHGAGHLGLQWYPPHPDSTAVNWGGYDAGGHELSGSSVPPAQCHGQRQHPGLPVVASRALPAAHQPCPERRGRAGGDGGLARPGDRPAHR